MRLWMRLARHARGPPVLIAVVAYIVGSLLWFRLGPMGQLEGGILDDDRGYSHAEAMAHFDGLGLHGRALYQGFLAGDMLYAVLYMVALTMVLGAVLVRWPRLAPLGPLLALPAVAAILDWWENIQLLRLLAAYPQLDPDAVWLTSQTTRIKLWTVSAAHALAAAGAVALLVDSVLHPVRRGSRARRRV